MMGPVSRIDGRNANALQGTVRWDPAKSLWNNAMLFATVVLGPLYFTWGALLVFMLLTYSALLLGHSVGMHRRLIHRSYDCHKWLERTLVYLGVLGGVAGPYGVLCVHDHRDWAQRGHACHDYFAHRRQPLIDLLWQLNCRFDYAAPPRFTVEPEFADDRFYQLLEKTWMWQQAPVALILFWLGGIPWVVWGVCARVTISVTGHWAITYWCHRPGRGDWRVTDAVVQGANLPGLGWLTHGECWHNNHHAFPESAQIGLQKGQTDPGWFVIRVFAQLGWAWNMGQPRPMPQREDLSPLRVEHDTRRARQPEVRPKAI